MAGCVSVVRVHYGQTEPPHSAAKAHEAIETKTRARKTIVRIVKSACLPNAEKLTTAEPSSTTHSHRFEVSAHSDNTQLQI
jgi:hypothetical protein